MDDSPNLSLKRIQGNEDVSVDDSRNIFGMGGQIITRPRVSGSMLHRTCNFSDLTSSPVGANASDVSSMLMTGSPQLDIAKAAALQDKLQIEDDNNNIKVKSAKAKNSRKHLAVQTIDKKNLSISKLRDSNNNKSALTSKQVSENRLPKAVEKAPKKKLSKIFSTKNVAKIIEGVIKSDAMKITDSKPNKPKKKPKTATEDTLKEKRKNSAKKCKVPEGKVEEKPVPGILQLDMNNNNTAIQELLKEAAGMLQRNSTEKVKIHSKRKSHSKKRKKSKKIAGESRFAAETNQLKKSKDKEPKSRSKSKGLKNKDYTVNTVEVFSQKADPVQIKGVKLFNSDKCGGDTVNKMMALPGKSISRKKAQTKLVVDIGVSKTRQMTSLPKEKSEKVLKKIDEKNNADSFRTEKGIKSCTIVKETSRQMKLKTELESNLLSSQLNKSTETKNVSSTNKGKAKPRSPSPIVGHEIKIKLKSILNAEGDSQVQRPGGSCSKCDILIATENPDSKRTLKKVKKVVPEESGSIFVKSLTPGTPATAVFNIKSSNKIKKDKKLSSQFHESFNKNISTEAGAGIKKMRNPKPKTVKSDKLIERQNSCKKPSTSKLCSISAGAETESSKQIIEDDSFSNADRAEINPQNSQLSLKSSNDDEKQPEIPITVKFPELLEFRGPANVEYDVFMAVEEMADDDELQVDDNIDIDDDDEDEDIDSDESGSIALKRKKQKEMLKKFLEKKPDLKGVKGVLEEEEDELSEEEEEYDEETEYDEVEEEEEEPLVVPIEKKPKKHKKEKKVSIKKSTVVVEEEEENNNIEEETDENPWWSQMYQNPWGQMMDQNQWGQMMGQGPWGQDQMMGQGPWGQDQMMGQGPWGQDQMMGQNPLEQMLVRSFAQNAMQGMMNPYSQYPGMNPYCPYPYPGDPYQQNYGYDPCSDPCPPPPDQGTSSSSCDEDSSTCTCSETTSSCSTTSTSDSCSECDKPILEDVCCTTKNPMIPLVCETSKVKYRQGYEMKSKERFMPCIQTIQAGAISFTLPSKVQHKTTIRVAHFPQPVNDTTIINGVPESQLPALTQKNPRPGPIGFNLPSNFPMPTPTSNCCSFNEESSQCNNQGYYNDNNNNPVMDNMMCCTEPDGQMQGNLMPTMQPNFLNDLQMISLLLPNGSACQNPNPIGANRQYQNLYCGPNRNMVDQNGDTVIYDL